MALHREAGSRGTQKVEEGFASYLYSREPNLSFGVSGLRVASVS